MVAQSGDHKAPASSFWAPHVDQFATRWNTKLPTFVSLVPDPQALVVDPLSLSWQNLWAYAFPPHQLFTKVMTKLRQSNAQLILVAGPALVSRPHEDKWKSVLLFPHPCFISKTQLRTKGAQSLQKLVIPALLPRLGPDMSDDCSLCPVRALKIYLTKTEDKCKNKELLFISYKDGHKGDLHKNTLSGWIRKLIHFVYKTAEGEVLPLTNARTHEVRALAASLAFRGSVDLEDILSACLWASHSTFTDFYLWDIALLTEGLHHLGPIVAAQQSLTFNVSQ